MSFSSFSCLVKVGIMIASFVLFLLSRYHDPPMSVKTIMMFYFEIILFRFFTSLGILWNISFIFYWYATHRPEKLMYNISIKVPINLSVAQSNFNGVTLEYFGNRRPPLKSLTSLVLSVFLWYAYNLHIKSYLSGLAVTK